MKPISGFALALAVIGATSAAWGQTTAPHPLRPASSPPPAVQAPTRSETVPPVQGPPSARTKRPRSPAQLANDERLRACGREWRAQKDALKAQGLTWYRFSAECRKRLKGVRI